MNSFLFGIITQNRNNSTQSGVALPPFTDDFNRADENPIAGDWETGLGANGSVKILSNEARGVSGNGVASVKASSLNISSDQRAVIKYTGGNPEVRFGAVVRMQANGAHYRVWYSQDFQQGAIVYVNSAGTETEIGSRFFPSYYYNPGNSLGLEVNGTSLTAYRVVGGTRTDFATRTDSTLTGGQPGFFVHADTQVDDFEATNY